MDLDPVYFCHDNDRMIRRTEGYFRGYQDFELYYQTWTPNSPRGTLVVTHGLGEHSESYQRLAEGLSKTDWEIFCWDLRGHGRSEGRRGVIKQFEDFTLDLTAFLEHVQQIRPRRPLVLLGHSMGGLINVKTVIDNENLGLKAMALSSPLMGISVEVPQFKKIAAKYLRKYLPEFTLYNEILYNKLTSDKEVITEYQHDPLRHDRISAALYLEMMETMERATAQASKIWLPILIQQAGDDQIVSRSATERFFEKLGSTNKKLIIYDGFQHEIFNELKRAIVFSDLEKWLAPYLEA